MATTPAPAQPDSIFDRLAANRNLVGSSLIGLGLALLAIPIGVSLAYGSDGATISVWGGVLAALSLLAGSTIQLTPPNSAFTPGERLRLVLLTWGGCSGFFTALLGLILPFTASLQPVFTGGLLEWRKNPGTLLSVGAALFGGLILMFLSLQLAHGLERSRAILRRLLYGYNAILSCLLLFIILLFANVLSYVTLWPFEVLGETIDWTRNKQYTLNEGFSKLLKSLDQPVHVYAMVSQGGPLLRSEIEGLLKNCHDTAPRNFDYDFLSRDTNFRKVADLQKKYNFPEPEGLLVVYGNEDGKPLDDFIQLRDVVDAEGRRFVGETALYKSIDYLTQGKQKPTVYFTQGNGELSYTRAAQGKPANSMATLIDNLSQGNYVPKELTYDSKESAQALAKRLLDEAEVVVVARPSRSLPQPLVAALQEFVRGNGKKRGKLFLLFDSISDQDGKMVVTGLEPLLLENQLRLGNDRIICPRYAEFRNFNSPLQFLGLLNPISDNPIVRGLDSETGMQMQFPFENARSLEIVPGNRQQVPSASRAESIIVVPQDLLAWGATNLAGDPRQLVVERQRNRAELFSVRSKPALVVGAVVTQAQDPQMPPTMPGAPPPPPQNQRPVMVVFSDATWVSDQYLQERSPEKAPQNWSLFANSLTWLRERPDTGVKADPREVDMFPRVKATFNFVNIVFIPGLLMLVAIIGLGLGVWVVRRR